MPFVRHPKCRLRSASGFAETSTAMRTNVSLAALLFCLAATAVPPTANSGELRSGLDLTMPAAAQPAPGTATAEQPAPPPDLSETPPAGPEPREPAPGKAEDEKPTDAPYKRIDAADLALSPAKYAGRNIEVLNARCYYAGPGDYRCILDGSEPALTVFTKAISNGDAASYIEEDCDAIKVALVSWKCRVALRFKYTEDEIDDDVLSGFEQRITLRPPAVTAYWAKIIRRRH